MLRMQLQLSRLMENKVTLYGASGHGKVIIDILESMGWVIDSILDDNPNLSQLLSYPITRPNASMLINTQQVIISIGNNRVRKILSKSMNCTFATAIHPTSSISTYARVQEGTVVMAGVIINSESTIGKHCIVNSGAVVEHDCFIDDFVHISPNASLAGNVRVMEGAHVGIGASVIQGITIGKWATIGAGSVIINDVPDYAVVVGNPGKIIKYTSANE